MPTLVSFVRVVCAVLAIAAATPALAQQAAPPARGATGIYPSGVVPIAPYSPGVLRGDTLFVSGQIPHVDGAVPAQAADGVDDIKDQTTIVLNNIHAVLREGGMDWGNVAQVTVFITDLSKFGQFNEVYGAIWKGPGLTPPARATVEVSKLPGGTDTRPVLIEISAIAVR